MMPALQGATALTSKKASALLDQRAGALLQGSKGLVAGDDGTKLVVIPFAFRFRRLLDFVDVHIMHHATVFADAAVLRKEVVRSSRILAITVFASSVPAASTAFRYRLQIMHG